MRTFMLNEPNVPKRPTFCFFSEDQKNIYTLHNLRRSDTYLAVWDQLVEVNESDKNNKKSLIFNRKLIPDSMTSACINKSKNLLGMGDNDGKISMYDLKIKKMINTTKIHSLPSNGIIFSENTNEMKSGGVDYKLCRYNI